MPQSLAVATNDDSLSVDHLRTFIAVIDEGSQTKAKDVLNVGQSTVARHIKRVKAYFGCELFEPGSPATLSAAGVEVATLARRMLGELERAREEVGGGRPVLRIGFIRIARPMLEHALRELWRPDGKSGFDVRLHELSSQAQARKLGRELDVAVCYARDALFAEQAGFEQAAISSQPYALAVPEAAIRRGVLDRTMLRRLHYVHVPRTLSPHVVIAGDRWLRTQRLAPAQHIECNLATELIAYAGAGGGYGFLPALWSMTNRDGVTFAPVRDFAPTATIAAFWLPKAAPWIAPLLDGMKRAAGDAMHGLESAR